jgi:hypothetical protein
VGVEPNNPIIPEMKRTEQGIRKPGRKRDNPTLAQLVSHHHPVLAFHFAKPFGSAARMAGDKPSASRLPQMQITEGRPRSDVVVGNDHLFRRFGETGRHERQRNFPGPDFTAGQEEIQVYQFGGTSG